MMPNTILFNKAITDVVERLQKDDYIAGLFPNMYGRAERHHRYENNKRVVIPIVYDRNGEYIDVRPSDRVGNNSFWYVRDGQDVVQGGLAYRPRITAIVSGVFWFGTDKDYRVIEEVKNRLLYRLNNMTIPNGRLVVNKIYEECDHVFEDFTITDEHIPFMMHPYGGLRFECEMSVQQDCITIGSFNKQSYNEDYE